MNQVQEYESLWKCNLHNALKHHLKEYIEDQGLEKISARWGVEIKKIRINYESQSAALRTKRSGLSKILDGLISSYAKLRESLEIVRPDLGDSFRVIQNKFVSIDEKLNSYVVHQQNRIGNMVNERTELLNEKARSLSESTTEQAQLKNLVDQIRDIN